MFWVKLSQFIELITPCIYYLIRHFKCFLIFFMHFRVELSSSFVKRDFKWPYLENVKSQKNNLKSILQRALHIIKLHIIILIKKEEDRERERKERKKKGDRERLKKKRKKKRSREKDKKRQEYRKRREKQRRRGREGVVGQVS